MMKDQTLKQIQEDAARQAIIDTARKIIIQQGAGNLSIRTLAKSVGCSPATIYKYFEDKEAILEAIRQEGWRLMGELNEAHDFGGLSPIEALKLSGKIYLDFPRKYPEHYMLMFGSVDAAPMSVEYIFSHPNFRGLIEMMGGLMAAGILRNDAYTPEQLAMHIWTTVHAIAMLELTVLRDDPQFPLLADQMLEAFAKSIVHSQG